MNETKKTEFELEMDKEVERRLKIMEKPGYDMGEKFSKGHWIGAITVIILSIIVISLGTF